MVLVFTVGVTIVAAPFPAHRAAKLDPVTALLRSMAYISIERFSSL
jgi:ABC-type lipoprotein release transport system permease subunit